MVHERVPSELSHSFSSHFTTHSLIVQLLTLTRCHWKIISVSRTPPPPHPFRLLVLSLSVPFSLLTEGSIHDKVTKICACIEGDTLTESGSKDWYTLQERFLSTDTVLLPGQSREHVGLSRTKMYQVMVWFIFLFFREGSQGHYGPYNSRCV